MLFRDRGPGAGSGWPKRTGTRRYNGSALRCVPGAEKCALNQVGGIHKPAVAGHFGGLEHGLDEGFLGL